MNKSLIESNIATVVVTLAPDANQRKKELLDLTKLVLDVEDAKELQIAVAQMREIKRLTAEVEATRKMVKTPVLNLGKRIDQIAEDYLAELNQESLRINKLVTTFQAAEQERVRLENERMEVERREKEKKAIEAQKELERLQNASKPNFKKEIKAEGKLAEAQKELVQTQTVLPAVRATASGLVTKNVVCFEITDKAALYGVRPEWFNLEEKRSLINASITKDTKLPGLKVWEEIKTSTRG